MEMPTDGWRGISVPTRSKEFRIFSAISKHENRSTRGYAGIYVSAQWYKEHVNQAMGGITQAT
jgi:hypothetical protein